ncbi:hypothetical protein FIV02_17240 [Pseudomonas sp. THAF187a]|uniref:hypothetical protein n=1 Tax=unclassified Pseudomonas TaxID=196821 RepID=UPI0012691A8B|nr:MULTISPECIES: hypothetical protein [unclassified Pseudomonas]QFT23318.1 hypothetical protein FIV02_17240 [Pseudomonas sp. THAF187a]QFT43505.1 hypothetical protein FIU98_17220 [Pseudomonas sp. THAF42]
MSEIMMIIGTLLAPAIVGLALSVSTFAGGAAEWMQAAGVTHKGHALMRTRNVPLVALCVYAAAALLGYGVYLAY